MNTYQISAQFQCPNDNSFDTYRITIRSKQTILCEAICKAIADLQDEPIFQETLTRTLAEQLKSQVSIEGEHFGVQVSSTWGEP